MKAYPVIAADGTPSELLQNSVARAISGLDFIESWSVKSYLNEELVLAFRVSEKLTAEMSDLLAVATTEIISDFGEVPRTIEHRVEVVDTSSLDECKCDSTSQTTNANWI